MAISERVNRSITRIPGQSKLSSILLKMYNYDGIDRVALDRADFKTVGVRATLHLAGSVFSRIQNSFGVPHWTKG